MSSYTKDPDATLDYSVDWSAQLDDGDTITASSWPEVDDGITVDSHEHTDTAAVVWVSGGTAGTTYALTNRITTAGGRIDDRTIRLKIKER